MENILVIKLLFLVAIGWKWKNSAIKNVCKLACKDKNSYFFKFFRHSLGMLSWKKIQKQLIWGKQWSFHELDFFSDFSPVLAHIITSEFLKRSNQVRCYNCGKILETQYSMWHHFMIQFGLSYQITSIVFLQVGEIWRSPYSIIFPNSMEK